MAPLGVMRSCSNGGKGLDRDFRPPASASPRTKEPRREPRDPTASEYEEGEGFEVVVPVKSISCLCIGNTRVKL